MSTYPSLYRAKATQVALNNGQTIQAVVPQVFGDATVSISMFLGAKPLSGGFGWVLFQGGNPEFPVWASGQGDLVIGPGGIDGVQTILPGTGIAVNDVDPFHPTISTSAVLALLAGTGVTIDATDPQHPIVTSTSGGDEVWIGTSDPIVAHPTIELWFDSDDEPAAVDNANYWNTAWGIIASATATASSWSNATGTLSDITVTTGSATISTYLYATRRYRVYWQCQVTSTVAGDQFVMQPKFNGSVYGENNVCRINAANTGEFTWFETLYTPATDGPLTYSIMGRRSSASTGTVSVFNIGNSPMLMLIEDIGPVAKAAVNPPTGQPTMVTAGNALGIIARAAEQGPSGTVLCPVSSITAIYEQLTVTMLAGRRYRIVCFVRAASGSPASAVQMNFTGMPVTQNDSWQIVDGSYRPLRAEYIMDGDGVTRSVQPVVTAGAVAAITVYTGEPVSGFYIEDVGPTSFPASPLPDTYPGWSNLTFGAGWQGYQGGSTVYGTGQYRKMGDIVTLRGLVETNSAIGTIGVTIGTLPVGFRPPYQSIFNQQTSVTGISRIDVGVPGIINITGAAPATANWVSLNGISFSVTP